MTTRHEIKQAVVDLVQEITVQDCFVCGFMVAGFYVVYKYVKSNN